MKHLLSVDDLGGRSGIESIENRSSGFTRANQYAAVARWRATSVSVR